MGTDRLEAFSDGVMAVAITLLALNLTVLGPHHGSTLASQLHSRWPAFAGYLVSFLTIGIIWVNHHNLFKNIEVIDRTLLFANLALLFFVVLIPFTTSTLAQYLTVGDASAHLAAALYCATLLAMGLSFAFVFVWSIRRGLFRVKFSRDEARQAAWRFGAGNVAYVVAILVALVSAPVALVITFLVALYYVFERTATSPNTSTSTSTDSA
jgi:uncharacterized membrane protein